MKKILIIALGVLACFRLSAQDDLGQRLIKYARHDTLNVERLPNISKSLYPVTTYFTYHDWEVLEWWNSMMENVNRPALVVGEMEHAKCEMPDISNLRMVGQVVTPQTEAEQKNQEAELAWFRRQGFNGALLVWKGEPPEILANIAQQLKAEGWMLAWTFGPEESATDNVYVDPLKYAEACQLILPYCSFVIPAFRKAAMPHFDVMSKDYPAWHLLQAHLYRSILIELIREEAPDIPIMGETTLRATSPYALISSMEAETAGRIVFEATYAGYRMEKVMKYLHRQQVDEPYLFCITGTKPYYERCELGWDCDLPSMWRYNLETCKVINQLKQAALVLAGGGGGTRRLWNKDLSDDLTKTTWRK
jgi:hypothetical protein